MASTINIANVTVRDVFTTKHGAKVASIKDDENDLVYQPNEFLRVPFEPSTWDKDPTWQRLNLVLETTPQMLEEFQKFDDWLIKYIAEHSERLLKKRLSVEQVRGNYTSCVKTSDKYPATIKTKIDLGTGKHAVYCWSRDSDGCAKPSESPEYWREFRARPRLHITHLWVMGSSFGAVVRVADAMLQPDETVAATQKERVNPFQ